MGWGLPLQRAALAGEGSVFFRAAVDQLTDDAAPALYRSQNSSNALGLLRIAAM